MPMQDAFTETVRQLADESRPLRLIDLTPLSDLGRSRVPEFQAAWTRLSSRRQLDLAAMLVERAENDIQMDFRTLLRELLSDAQAAVRRLAIEGLWEDERPSLIGLLVRLLHGDPEPEVRAAAAMSLGRFVLLGALGEIKASYAAEAEDALRGAWARPGEALEVRRRALEGLACCGAGDVPEMILAAYHQADPLMRQSALFAMGRTGDSRWADSVLQELASAEPAMRFEAAAAAGEIGLTTAVAPLIELLEDVDSAVREAAALALGKIGGRKARRALEGLLRGPDERLAEAAREALNELIFDSEDPVAPWFAVGSALRTARGETAGFDDENDLEDDEENGEDWPDADELMGGEDLDVAEDDLFDDDMSDGEDWEEDEDWQDSQDEDEDWQDDEGDEDWQDDDDEEEEDWLDDDADENDFDDDDSDSLSF